MVSLRNRFTVFLLILVGTSCSKPLGKEPIYNGRPLSEWAMMTTDGSLDEPSDRALEAIKAVQAIGPVAIPFLLKWIQPPISDSRMPGGAVGAFKALGPQAKPAIPKLAEIVNKRGFTGAYDAVEALSYLGPEAIPFLLAAATNHHGQQIQYVIIRRLGRSHAEGAVAIPALIEWSRDEQELVRWAAIMALGEIGQEPEIVVPVLLQLLSSPDRETRGAAASAIGYFHKDAKEAVPILIKLLDDPTAQTGAIISLASIGEQMDIVFPKLVEKLHDKNRVIRRVAAFAMAVIGGTAAYNALQEMADDPDGFVREAVFKSLKRIDPVALERSGRRFY
jgi:HEAT repeat protein